MGHCGICAPTPPIHARVFEYDGAYECLACKARWGAFPGRPVMPDKCSTPTPARDAVEKYGPPCGICGKPEGDHRVFAMDHGFRHKDAVTAAIDAVWESRSIADRRAAIDALITAARADERATLASHAAAEDREGVEALYRGTSNRAAAELLLTRLASLRAALAQRSKPDLCGVCAGTGKPVSGLPCICGGSGTAIAEMLGLREELYDTRAALATAEAEREALAKALGELRSEMPGTCVCDEAYSGRGLTDPQCGYHDYGAFCLGIIDTALAGRKGEG